MSLHQGAGQETKGKNQLILKGHTASSLLGAIQ